MLNQTQTSSNNDIDVLDLFHKVSQQELDFRSRKFLAPYTKASKYAIVFMRKEMLYKFRIFGFQGSGIGIFRPIDPNNAKYIEEAPFDQARSYLNALPNINLILCYEVEDGWISWPMNEESAKKDFGIEPPIMVLNVSAAQRFDVITARFDGENFWYDQPFAGTDPLISELMRKQFEKGSKKPDISGITPELRLAFDDACAAWKKFVKLSINENAKKLLENGTGRMSSFVLKKKNIEIKWTSSSGSEYNSFIKKELLDGISAGICADAHLHLQDLQDLKHMIEPAERRSLIESVRHIIIPDEQFNGDN